MNILAIDTVTELCTVALMHGSEIFELESEQKQKGGHSQHVLGLVDQLLTANNLMLSDLGGIACDMGPGSFTGLRVGLGVCQGLAYGQSLAVCGVSSLRALAVQAKLDDGYVIAALDARMGQVYIACFQFFSDGACKTVVEETLLTVNGFSVEKLLSVTSDLPVCAVGTGWPLLVQASEESTQHIDHLEDIQFPRATAIARLAQPMDWHSADQLQPLYLRNNVAVVSQKNRLVPARKA